LQHAEVRLWGSLRQFQTAFQNVSWVAMPSVPTATAYAAAIITAPAATSFATFARGS